MGADLFDGDVDAAPEPATPATDPPAASELNGEAKDVPAADEPAADPPADDDEWTHETIVFLGDTLEVRKPTQQALAAFSLATSKHVTPQMRNDMTGLFITRHLSEESYSRVFSRLMDPDDEEYTLESIGALMKSIVELATPAS